ncbi:hypothetical protein G3N58_24125 [Paraburkholderia sp. Ac-20342]|uniref:hypothetical protein n=1 Tax=Paraburkholderia sp. Ac-20342 TaxID=2703889 RepID=UPI00197EBE41|nr:hypothetical protein [Paraburkholderia sp. Ac-20342]MBN3849886.1 hypothetical protein [Paraburkholderia sp. Ac-20342]
MIDEFIVEFVDDVAGNSEGNSGGNDMGLLFRKSNESGGASAQMQNQRGRSRHFTSYGSSVD